MDERNSAGSKLHLPRMARLRRRLIIVVAGLLAATGIAVVTASPAAARPVCTFVAYFQLRAGYEAQYGVPATPGYFDDCDVAYGATGPAVVSLQKSINACYSYKSEIRAYMAGAGYPGWTGLSTDGQFGNITKTAVKAVQNYLGVGVDGSFGPITRNAMNWPWTNGGGQATIGGCSTLRQPLTIGTFYG